MSSPQKNKRLSQSDRTALYRFAKRQIEATQDRSELDAAYEAVASAVHAEVVRRWPQSDMRVLAKYDAAAPDRCVYVADGGSQWDYEQFCFNDGDKRIALRPTIRGCTRLPIQLESEGADAFAAYLAAVKTRDEQIKARVDDFNALIYNTSNFNALAEVWPAVEAMRGEIVGSGAALSVLSNEAVDRIKADPALELAA